MNPAPPKRRGRLRLQLSVAGAFDLFASRLEITDLQQSTVSARQQAVRAAVERRLHVLDTFLTGSYRRHTLIGPLAAADVDLFCVLDPGYYYSAGQAWLLNLVHEVLRQTYSTTPRISPNGQAVTIRFTDFVVEVAPGFHRQSGGYLLPSPAERRWIETNPKTHETFIAIANATHDGKLVPMIKMIKAWNRNSGSRLRSFYLELMVESILRSVRISDYPTGAAYVFDHAQRAVAYKQFDPAGLDGGQVAGLARGGVDEAAAALALAHNRALDAFRLQRAGQTRQARARWRQIFGDPFPAG
jgi:hypothetical protein